LWVSLLAYNLIRVRMAQAAAVHDQLPRTLSFTAAKTHIHNFAPRMSASSKPVHHRLETELLKAIASCREGQRPGRTEPRAIKKRRQKYSYLTKPRPRARQGLAA
jgi:putative transposase